VDVSSSGLNMFRQEGATEDRFNTATPNEVSFFSYFRAIISCPAKKSFYCFHQFFFFNGATNKYESNVTTASKQNSLENFISLD